MAKVYGRFQVDPNHFFAQFMAKVYGRFQVDPNHFFAQLLNIIYFTTIYSKVNGTVVS